VFSIERAFRRKGTAGVAMRELHLGKTPFDLFEKQPEIKGFGDPRAGESGGAILSTCSPIPLKTMRWAPRDRV
jgi:hypothetical protein